MTRSPVGFADEGAGSLERLAIGAVRSRSPQPTHYATQSHWGACGSVSVGADAATPSPAGPSHGLARALAPGRGRCLGPGKKEKGDPR